MVYDIFLVDFNLKEGVLWIVYSLPVFLSDLKEGRLERDCELRLLFRA